jgi:hypothetical protein
MKSYLVRLERKARAFLEIKADDEMDALRKARIEVSLRPDIVNWTVGEVDAQDVDVLDG